MKNTILLLFSCLFVLTSCYQEDEINSDLINTNMTRNKALGVSDCIVVAPSGDITGVTDANNIEDALNNAKSFGGTVCLTDGDEKSIDNYYTSRNIVVEGFNGALRGERKNNTLIYAGRMSESIGFSSAYSPFWAELGYYPLLPVILQFDNSVGDVEITDLSIILDDVQPTDIQNNYWGRPSTYMQSFIEILGGEHNTIIKNVRLKGRPSSDFGNLRNMNVDSGIHVMLGPPSGTASKTGYLTVKNVEVENTGGGAVLFMRFYGGSKINVDSVIAKNVYRGIYAGGIFNSSVNLSNMDISLNQNIMWGDGITIWNVPSSLQIMHNTISGGKGVGMLLYGGVNNATIFENKFINIENNFAGMVVMGVGNSIYSNDYKDSNLPGWTSTTNGPGAIYMVENSKDNIIHEMKFPEGQNLSLCQMILDYGNNEIHNWQPCENWPKSSFSKLEPEFNSNSRFHISKNE